MLQVKKVVREGIGVIGGICRYGFIRLGSRLSNWSAWHMGKRLENLLIARFVDCLSFHSGVESSLRRAAILTAFLLAYTLGVHGFYTD